MFDFKEIRSTLVDLLLADHETSGRPVADADQRRLLLGSLGAFILDADAFGEYWRWLDANDPARRHRSILEDDRFQAVLDRGLDALDDSELAELALNPIALGDLGDAVAEFLPDAWMPAIEEAAADLVQRHGVTFEPPGISGDERLRAPQWMTVGSFQAGGAPGQAWDFEVSAEEARWEPGLPGDLDETRAAVRVERDEADGSLTLSTEGFLQVGLGCAVEVVWRSADGSERAVGRVVDAFVAVRLLPENATPPASGDRLILTKWLRADADSPGWTVHVALVFP